MALKNLSRSAFFTIRRLKSKSFLQLIDTPNSYEGYASYFVAVKADKTGLEFVASSSLNHNFLSSTHSDTVAGTPVAGDIIYANATPKWTKLPISTNSYVLTLISGLPSWQNPQHKLLSSVHSDADASDAKRGALAVGQLRIATPIWKILELGTVGKVLYSDGSDAIWQQLSHTELSNIGTNTHAQIDTHIALGISDNIDFNDGDANAHHIVIQSGKITEWTIT